MQFSKPILSCLIFALSAWLLSGCGVGPATPGNWEEKDWPEHDYVDVAEMSRSVLTGHFGFSVIDYEHDREEKYISFSSSWNEKDAHRAVFRGSGKRRKIWVEIEEVAVDLRYDPKIRSEKEVSDKGRLRIEKRGGRYVKIISRLAISCKREKNDSTLHADDPIRGKWKSDGFDDDAVQIYMAEISQRLRDTRRYEFDASDRGKSIHLKYFREEELTPAEKKERNARNTNRIRDEIEKSRRNN